MAQIGLPDNSKVKKGKYFKDKTGSKNLRKVNVYRWDPSTEENPLLRELLCSLSYGMQSRLWRLLVLSNCRTLKFQLDQY